MTSLLPELPANRAWRAGDEVVCRTILCDWDSVRTALAEGGFERVDRLVEMWRVATVLERVHRVEVEVARVAVDAAELRIVPWTARWPRWGSRRQYRYLEAAHAAADDFQEILSVPVAQRASARENRADIAVFMGRLQPFIDDQFKQARDEDRREAREAYAYCPRRSWRWCSPKASRW